LVGAGLALLFIIELAGLALLFIVELLLWLALLMFVMVVLDGAVFIGVVFTGVVFTGIVLTGLVLVLLAGASPPQAERARASEAAPTVAKTKFLIFISILILQKKYR
jgi:hypothetical protein